MHNFTSEEIEAVKHNEIDYFQEHNHLYTQEKKEQFLNAALAWAKVPTIKFFLDQGVQVINHASLMNLMKLKRKADFLQYLEDKGVNLLKNGHILLFNACIENNEPFARYLAQKVTELDSRAAVLSAVNMISKYSDDDISKTEKILDILLLKLSPTKASEIFKDTSFRGSMKESNEAFLQKKLISHALSFQANASPPPLKI